MSYLSPHQPVIVSSRSLTPDRRLPFPAYPNPRYIASPVGLWGAKHQTHFGAL